MNICEECKTTLRCSASERYKGNVMTVWICESCQSVSLVIVPEDKSKEVIKPDKRFCFHK
ncbi:hypothetical protein LCGC14_0766290 [marine sediment metagenome]|uniref:Uncharacterized protein n=1 Tax=marine sediment metagenome TaxID=412755 RepID=A0A0F9PZR7_9ZZZZ